MDRVRRKPPIWCLGIWSGLGDPRVPSRAICVLPSEGATPLTHVRFLGIECACLAGRGWRSAVMLARSGIRQMGVDKAARCRYRAGWRPSPGRFPRPRRRLEGCPVGGSEIHLGSAV